MTVNDTIVAQGRKGKCQNRVQPTRMQDLFSLLNNIITIVISIQWYSNGNYPRGQIFAVRKKEVEWRPYYLPYPRPSGQIIVMFFLFRLRYSTLVYQVRKLECRLERQRVILKRWNATWCRYTDNGWLLTESAIWTCFYLALAAKLIEIETWLAAC